MRDSEPQAVNSLVNTSALLTIQEKGKALCKLNNLVHKLLSDNLSKQCRVANYRQGILIINVASASWLTRLRYEQEKLRTLLRQNGLGGLTSIQFKVDPELNHNKCVLQCASHNEESTTNNIYPRQITPQSAGLLLTLAEHCSPKLKNNLIKLANHVVKTDNR